MKRLLILLLMLFPVAVRADSIAALRTVLRTLPAKRPVGASYERRETTVAKGRFYDGGRDAASTAEAHVGEDGVTLTYPRALLDRGRAEEVERLRGAKAEGGATAGGVSPLRIAEMLDYAPSLNAILERGLVAEERPLLFHGQQARLLVINLRQVTRPGVKEGHVKSTQDRLSLWLGADQLPLAAERNSTGTAGIFFLHADLKTKETWTFGRHQDRLIIVRYQRTDDSSGMGQTTHSTISESITIR